MSKVDSNFSQGCFFGILLLLLIPVACAIAMALGALGVASAESWFFAGNFSDGWHVAWSRPWVLLGWTLLFYGVVAGLFRSSK